MDCTCSKVYSCTRAQLFARRCIDASCHHFYGVNIVFQCGGPMWPESVNTMSRLEVTGNARKNFKLGHRTYARIGDGYARAVKHYAGAAPTWNKCFCTGQLVSVMELALPGDDSACRLAAALAAHPQSPPWSKLYWEDFRRIQRRAPRL